MSEAHGTPYSLAHCPRQEGGGGGRALGDANSQSGNQPYKIPLPEVGKMVSHVDHWTSLSDSQIGDVGPQHSGIKPGFFKMTGGRTPPVRLPIRGVRLKSPIWEPGRGFSEGTNPICEPAWGQGRLAVEDRAGKVRGGGGAEHGRLGACGAGVGEEGQQAMTAWNTPV